MLLEQVQARLPFALLLGDPSAELPQSIDVEPAWPPLTVDPLMDQAATTQYADVTGDGLVGEVERFGELADGRLAASQPGDDRPARSIGERGEHRVEVG